LGLGCFYALLRFAESVPSRGEEPEALVCFGMLIVGTLFLCWFVEGSEGELDLSLSLSLPHLANTRPLHAQAPKVGRRNLYQDQ
jgi:hypothetical protein